MVVAVVVVAVAETTTQSVDGNEEEEVVVAEEGHHRLRLRGATKSLLLPLRFLPLLVNDSIATRMDYCSLSTRKTTLRLKSSATTQEKCLSRTEGINGTLVLNSVVRPTAVHRDLRMGARHLTYTLLNTFQHCCKTVKLVFAASHSALEARRPNPTVKTLVLDNNPSIFRVL